MHTCGWKWLILIQSLTTNSNSQLHTKVRNGCDLLQTFVQLKLLVSINKLGHTPPELDESELRKYSYS
jgi:hypothetical protein